MQQVSKINLCRNCTKIKCSILQKYRMKQQLRDFCSTCYSWTRAHHKKDACVQVCRQSSSSPAGRPAFLPSALPVLFNGSCQVRCSGEPWVTASPPEEPPGFVEEQKFTSRWVFPLHLWHCQVSELLRLRRNNNGCIYYTLTDFDLVCSV